MAIERATNGDPSNRLKAAVGFGCAFLLVHGALALWLPDALTPLSTLCIVVAEMAAVAMCVRESFSSSGASRLRWILLALSILLQSSAMMLDLITEWHGIAYTVAPRAQMLLSTFDGLPILLAVSLQSGTRSNLLFRGIKIGLSLATGALFYVLILSVLPTSNLPTPARLVFLVRLMDALEIFLWCAAMIRLFAADSSVERRFFRCLAVFLGSATLLDAIHNRIIIRHDYVWLDLLVSAPPLLLLVAIAATSGERSRSATETSKQFTHIVQIASPVFLSLALLLLGIFVSRTEFYVGASAVVLALACYCALNVMLHVRAIAAEESLADANRQLTALSRTDGLTGVPNRRAFDSMIELESDAARRSGQPLSLLLIDIDHFKQLNDTLGHMAGDACLARAASALQSALPRSTDFLARYGGEEFAVLLPSTDGPGAGTVAEKMHRAIGELEIPHPAAFHGKLTVSIGVGVSINQEAESLTVSELIAAADRALYRAKERGRNCTEFHLQPEAATHTA